VVRSFFVWALVSADFVCLGVLGVALFTLVMHTFSFHYVNKLIE